MEQEYQANIDHINRLIETEQGLGKEYDRMLWTFSGGGLALSITLVGSFKEQWHSAFSWLYLSWAMFVACIVLTMLSVKFSQKAFIKEISLMCDAISDKGEISPEVYGGGWVRAALWFEILASLVFLIAIVSLFFFIGKNI